MKTRKFLTTADVAKLLNVTTDQVVGLIHAGALVAVDVSATGKKPRWRIEQTHVDAFIAARTSKPPAKPARRRKIPKPVHDYFPDK